MKFDFKLLKNDIKKAVPVIGLVALLMFSADALVGKICMSRILIGIPCPGCGLTRAFELLLTGQVAKATQFHPFWIPIVIMGLIWAFVRYFAKSNKMSKKVMRMLKVSSIILLILAILYYIYRMITWFPNCEPMKYDSNNLLELLRLIIKGH